ncbi:MAG: hypothetical protein AAFX87_02510 [Bacteroidota bacterium]
MSESTTCTVKLLKLHCYLSTEEDLDEIFIKLNGQKVWPTNAKYQKAVQGETMLDVSLESVPIGELLKLEVWDYDLLSSNDHLGNFVLSIDEGGAFRSDMHRTTEGSEARYSLEWEVS